MLKNKILVIGDLMLDEYWFGNSNRISPEAPAPVVNITKKEYRIGGAGNVALNLLEIGVNVTLVSSIGKDLDGKIIKDLLKKKSLVSHLSINKCKTIKKQRIFSQDHQMMRLDIESNKEDYEIKMSNDLKDKINKSKLIILSDYGKGTLLDIKNIIKYAKSKGKLIIIDPKGLDFLKYTGATILTPNFKEFSTIVGTVINETDLKIKSKQLIKKLKLDGLLVTRGKDGMTFITKNNILHKQSLAQDVFDVTGAGDTVIAAFSAYLSDGKSFTESIEMANIAASIVIKKVGTATASRKEIEDILNLKDRNLNKKYYKDPAELLNQIKYIKSKNLKIVMTNGCFDILHPGHIHLLENAKKFGDFIIVAINTDKSVKKIKGGNRPFNSLTSRIKMLTSLSCVDLVVSFNEVNPKNIIKMISPNILVKGGDYKIKDIIGADYVKSYNGEVKVVKLKDGYSTTKILNR